MKRQMTGFLGAATLAALSTVVFIRSGSVVIAAGTSCESLASLARPNTTITLAQTVPAGAFTPPVAERGAGGRGAGGRGTAPDQIIAAHLTNGTVDRTRPLCPYGKVAKYKGSGSTDEAANFACVADATVRGTR